MRWKRIEKNSSENGSKIHNRRDGERECVSFFNEIKTNEETENRRKQNKTKQRRREKRKCEAKVIWKCADFVCFQQETISRNNIVMCGEYSLAKIDFKTSHQVLNGILSAIELCVCFCFNLIHQIYFIPKWNFFNGKNLSTSKLSLAANKNTLQSLNHFQN